MFNSKATFLLLFATLLFLTEHSEATVRRICNVSYEKEVGYSEDQKAEVTFMTGSELNKSTNSFAYKSFNNYALIWFAKDKVAIFEISEVLLVSYDEFDNKDFKKLFELFGETTAKQVNGGSERKWKIKAKDYLSKWIDPRVE